MSCLVRLEGVSKYYPRVHRPRERLKAFAALMSGREPQDGARVLHDVSLEIRQGQSYGIIGENGAGKSTLLKILSGVISPSTGSVEVNARIAALLELGAGFQPDFSGMDNVRMKAALLGLSSGQLDQRLQSILDFADIGDYIHEPVKHYSSGMVVRLGFAVVAASDPELLITDEVLAVGDEAFQKKCLRWIESFLACGNTLLMVSHSMYLVQKLCSEALWLHGGEARMQGDVFDVTQSYLAWNEERNAHEKQLRESSTGHAGLYRVDSLLVNGVDSSSEAELLIQQGGDIEADVRIHSPDGRPPVALVGVVRADGTPVYGVASDVEGVSPQRDGEHDYRFRLRFDAPGLLPGSYSLRGHAMDPEGLRLCDTRERRFRIAGESRELGFVRLPHCWHGSDH